MKKKIIFVMLLLTLILVMAASAEATVASKPINVDYVDIKLFVNGNAITLQPDEEPFIFNGRTFVPIRFVSEALGQSVEWIDWIKAVKITGGSSAALAEKDKEIQDLKNQIASLKRQLDDEEEDEDGDLSDLEDQLRSDYDSLEDVDIDDISLSGDEDEVDVQIDVDLGEYDDEWEDLNDSDIEDFLDDLVSDIQDEFSEDTVVTGEINDIDSDETLVDFSKDGDDDLDIDYNDEDYRDSDEDEDEDADDAIDSLEEDTYYVGGIEFEVNITYNGDDSATAKFTALDDDAADDWDDLDDSDIEDDVTSICEDIVSAFEDDADISLDTVIAKFYDEENDGLKSFTYDVDDEELD